MLGNVSAQLELLGSELRPSSPPFPFLFPVMRRAVVDSQAATYCKLSVKWQRRELWESMHHHLNMQVKVQIWPSFSLFVFYAEIFAPEMNVGRRRGEEELCWDIDHNIPRPDKAKAWTEDPGSEDF